MPQGNTDRFQAYIPRELIEGGNLWWVTEDQIESGRQLGVVSARLRGRTQWSRTRLAGIHIFGNGGIVRTTTAPFDLLRVQPPHQQVPGQMHRIQFIDSQPRTITGEFDTFVEDAGVKGFVETDLTEQGFEDVRGCTVHDGNVWVIAPEVLAVVAFDATTLARVS